MHPENPAPSEVVEFVAQLMSEVDLSFNTVKATCPGLCARASKFMEEVVGNVSLWTEIAKNPTEDAYNLGINVGYSISSLIEEAKKCDGGDVFDTLPIVPKQLMSQCSTNAKTNFLCGLIVGFEESRVAHNPMLPTI